MTNTEIRIDQVILAFRAYGYAVVSSPIEGMEETYLQHLNEAFARLMKRFEGNAKTFKFRGRSKRALDTLHAHMPSPAWDIEVY